MGREGAGVADDALIDAVRNPTEVIDQGDGTIKYVGANAEVILNENREVVTAWATGRARTWIQP